MLNLLDTLAAPELFEPHFRGESWAPWQSFLKALFGLGELMTSNELALYRKHTGRLEPPAKPFAEAALIVGRRGGKSRVLALVAVFLAAFRDYTPYLAPGEVATIAVLAANRSQARSIFRFVSGLLKAVPLLTPLVEDENTEAIVLNNQVVIEISTASFRTTRGYSFAAVLCDEIAFWRQEESSANPDVEILRALRPGMANIPGSILLLASSPYAKRGELYAAFRKHFGRDGARVLVWKAETAAMNPNIDPAIIAEAYESDPEAAAAEYGAEFRSDLADFVTREAVDAVTCLGRTELPPEPGVTYSAFCDPSGGVNDAMTLAIGHLSSGAILVLDAVREVRPPFDPETTVADFAAVLRRFGISSVVGDRYAGEWPRARFREHGITYEPSARPKSDIYSDLLPLLNARRVELLDYPRVSAQLCGLERRTARSGKDSVDHSPGGHDDLANAVAGVLVGLDLDRRPALIRQRDLLAADERPVPLPEICDAVFAVLVTDDKGSTGVVYAADRRLFGAGLVLLDFAAAPLERALFETVSGRLAELAKTCRSRRGSLGIFADAPLVEQAMARGFIAHPIREDWTADPARLALRAAGHVAAGSVKLAGAAHERASTAPLLGALDFRGGDAADDPLRRAMLFVIALTFETTAA